MRFSARTWSLLSLLLFVAAAFFWLKGNEYEARKRLAPLAPVKTNAQLGSIELFSTRSATAQLATLSTGAQSAQSGTALSPISKDSINDDGQVDSAAVDKRFPHRLRNTQKPLKELVRDDNAVLLANALIDTTGQEPEIPPHLRAVGDPGSYIVQWKGAVDARFREELTAAGAEIISYVPNNAFYVKVDKSGADRLSGTVGVQSVLPFQPYYKLDPALLGFAVKQESLPNGARLRLTFLPGSTDIAQQVADLGVEVTAQENSPFGPQLIVNPRSDALVALAQLPSVQGIERSVAPVPASDLSRTILGVATNGSASASNYLGLTGKGVLVNINDVGVQPGHPALRDTTIYLPAPPVAGIMTANDDPDGHGTFVASLIAGNGANTPAPFQTNTVTSTNGTTTETNQVVVSVLPGSSTNASLRGLAPDADLLALPLGPVGPTEVHAKVQETWLIESAAATNYVLLARTNTLISNNSWTYQNLAIYDTSAARYDQAVRDALPGVPQHQPLLFVFSAGNGGFGEDDGFGGRFDSIESPGTAKNVITVGALEMPRFITNVSYTNYNEVTITNIDGSVTTTNEAETVYPFADITDSEDELAEFSSRGNVGIGLEGDTGRFKPDVVAPGTMVIAARSAGWNFNGFNTNDTNFGQMYFNLHTNMQPYRFESGSTIAAANISGVMALIQEYFQSQAPSGSRGPLSPALMKALLINGARSLNRNYDIAAKAAANYQGWGLPSLPNSLTSYSTNQHSSIDEKKWRLRYVDQSASNALSTGQSRTWNITLNSNSATFPMRVTLVWTDPPGNPAVAVKLVNDLDLVVTNLDTGLIYYGNNIPFGSDMTIASDPLFGDPEARDVINNVEQVMVADPSLLGSRFSITVRARRVNVNAVPNYHAVTGNANDVVQDFALVVSSEIGSNPLMNDPDPSNPNGYLPNLDVFDEFQRVAAVGVEARAGLTKITNGLPLIDQRVGANPSLIGGNGAVGQWNFYVFTNITESNSLVTAIAGSNVAFVTFNPPNLSRPRAIEADIDLYVSKNPELTNLNPVAVATAFKSVERGGTESVVFTNATTNDVFYIGVKAEDQEGAEFSLIGVSSDQPFEEERDGRIYLHGVPFEAAVLDGNPKRPTAGTMLAIGLSNRRVAHARVTTTTFHENFPDLVGVLTKQRSRIILNNHSFTTNNFGTNTFIYEDNPAFEIPGVTQPSDGPGDLNELVGYKVVGPWFLEMIDNSPSHTGRVQRFEIEIDPLRDDLLLEQVIQDTVNPGEMAFYPLDVPGGVTNLNFLFTDMNGTLQFFWREEALPTTNLFDVTYLITPPGRQFDIPVTGNRTYFMGLRNPGAAPVDFTLYITPSYADTNFNRFYDERTVATVPDVATLNSVIDVDVDKLVSDVLVGVKMKHPRTADIALTLISPQGSRILLAENRGAGNTAGFGSTIAVTNRLTNGTTVVTNQPSFLIFTDRTNLTRIPVKFADPAGSNSLTGVSFNSGFEFDPAGNYFTGGTLADGWQVSTGGQVSVISGPGYARTGNGMLSLGNAGISNQFNTTPGRPLIVRFSARRARLMDFFSTGVSDTGGPLFPQGSIDPHYYITNGFAPAYQLWGDEPPLQPPAIWTANGGLQSIPGSFSQWIAPYPRVPRTDLMGEFVYRTYVNLYEQTNIAGFTRRFRWAADDLGTSVRVNGVNYGFTPGLPSDFWNSPEHTLPAVNPGLNIIDFLTFDTNDVEGLRVDVPVTSAQRLRKSPVARMTLNIGGNTQTITVTNNWIDYAFAIAPSSTTDILSFQTSTGEVWIDNITVEASGGLFLHPEESLDLLEGERAMGEWRLEVRDTRTGMVLPTGEALDWSLELTFAETRNPAVQMQPGETAGPITLGSEEVLWVVLDPCQGATFARLQLRGIDAFDELMLFADLNGFPTGNIETDDFVPIPNNQPNGIATFDISTLLPPAARLTGKPIFIGIINQFIGVTNQLELEFQSDGNCSLTGPPPILTPDNPQVGSVDPDPTGGSTTNSNGGVFEFTVPPNARAAIVTVDSDGDVIVYGQKDTIPTSGTFQYRENDIATGGVETMIIATNSAPALSPGKYFVRVVNNTQQRVNFTINVTFDFGNSAPVTVTISKSPSANPVLQFFPTVPGVTYRIEAADQLSLTPGATVWTLLETRVATGTIETYEIVSFDFTRRHRFFRITRP